jgi:hypothetical protein
LLGVLCVQMMSSSEDMSDVDGDERHMLAARKPSIMPSVPENHTSIASIHLPAPHRKTSMAGGGRKASFPLQHQQGHRRSSTLAPPPMLGGNRRQSLAPASLRRASHYPVAGAGAESSLESFLEAPVCVENSYRMEPARRFGTGEVEGVIRGVLEQFLEGTRYDGARSGELTRLLADMIRERVKQRQYARYKIVSWVSICEKNDNNVRVASRGLWDATWDGFASVTFENESLYAIGNVYAIYHE